MESFDLFDVVEYKNTTWRVDGFLKETIKPKSEHWLDQVLFEAQQKIGPDNKRLTFCIKEEAEYLSLVGVCGAVAKPLDCKKVGVVGWTEEFKQERRKSYENLIGEVVF